MITQDEVKELFSYKDGSLYWNMDRGRSTKSGSLAGYFHKATGKKCILINKKNYKYHRIIYLHCHGFIPRMVDHIDGNALNNNIENLRECTSSQNNCNRKLQKNNKSGVKGVHWNNKMQCWIATIMKDSKSHYIGVFQTIKNAEIAIKELRKKLHGEFANHG